MNLVDVLNGFSIHPNHRYHVEEGLPLREVDGVHEDSCVYCQKKLLHDVVVCLKCFGVVLSEVAVDGLEELKGVVNYLIVGAAEVLDADIDDIHHKLLESCVRNVLNVAPEDCY